MSRDPEVLRLDPAAERKGKATWTKRSVRMTAFYEIVLNVAIESKSGVVMFTCDWEGRGRSLGRKPPASQSANSNVFLI